MKKIVFITLVFCGMCSTGFAQQEELKSAAANLEKKDYIKVIDDLNKAKKAVSKLISDQLGSVLPASFGEYKMQEVPMNIMDAQSVGINKVYAKPVVQKAEPAATLVQEPPAPGAPMTAPPVASPSMGLMNQEQITVSITTNMMMAGSVQSAHSMADSGMESNDVKVLRVKGYRAITKSLGSGMGTGMGMPSGGSVGEQAQAIVGGAFISVEARGVKEPGAALKFLESIDLEKLKAIVGE